MNFISVALPVYNGEKYLEEALDSICSQNYDNYELIVSDNHSTDGTSEILTGYAKRNNRIKVFRTDKTVSQVDNTNRVLELCNSNWVQFMCHDDIMLPGCLQYLNEVIELHKGNENLALIGHGPCWLFPNSYFYNQYFKIENSFIYKWEDFKKSNFNIEFKADEVAHFERKVSIEKMMDGDFAFYVPALTTALVKKDRMIALGGFDKKYIHFDAFAWINLLVHYDYVLINQPLTVTRIHGSQVGVNARKSLRTMRDFKQFWAEFYHQHKNIIRFDAKRKMFIFLKPISTSTGLICVELVKGNIGLAVKTFFRFPFHWYPFILAMLIKNYPREKQRTRELSKYVPLNDIYP